MNNQATIAVKTQVTGGSLNFKSLAEACAISAPGMLYRRRFGRNEPKERKRTNRRKHR